MDFEEELEEPVGIEGLDGFEPVESNEILNPFAVNSQSTVPIEGSVGRTTGSAEIDGDFDEVRFGTGSFEEIVDFGRLMESFWLVEAEAIEELDRRD